MRPGRSRLISGFKLGTEAQRMPVPSSTADQFSEDMLLSVIEVSICGGSDVDNNVIGLWLPASERNRAE